MSDTIHSKDFDYSDKNTNLTTIEVSRHLPESTCNKRLTLSWSSIQVRVKTNALINYIKKTLNDKLILDGIQGIVRQGDMLALMGASGSGKTTLLNALNFRTSGALRTSGKVMINGLHVTRNKLSSISCYIQQDDLFFGTLTVKEHLTFHAMLRMDSSFDRDYKLNRVNEVLKEFSLEKCKNVQIGIQGRIKGISGGQKRRLSFASEIFSEPQIIFCDEPTSGLDSHMAKSIINCLRSIANSGKIIICTIHQPSSDIFSSFDKVCVLSEGQMAYFGARNEAVSYFERTFFQQCPWYTNPADYLIDLFGLNVCNSKQEEEENRRELKEKCEMFIKSDMNKRLSVEIESQTKFNSAIKILRQAPWYTQLFYLTKRSYLNYFRNYRVFLIDCLMAIVTAIIGGILYFRSINEATCSFSQKNSGNVTTALFYIVCSSVLINTLSAILTFPTEIPIFSREHQTGVYGVGAYYLSKLFLEIPIYMVLPAINGTIIYFMIQFGCDATHFFIFLSAIILIANSAYSLGHVVSVFSSNVNLAISIASPLLAIQMIFSGFYLNRTDTTPEPLEYLKYTSTFHYGFEFLMNILILCVFVKMINQWANNKSLVCEYKNETAALCLQNGRDLLNGFEIDQDGQYLNGLMLVALIFIWRLLSFCILFFKTWNPSFKFKKVKLSGRGGKFKINNSLISSNKT